MSWKVTERKENVERFYDGILIQPSIYFNVDKSITIFDILF